MNINTTKVKKSRQESVDWQKEPFGTVFTDHMFTADYKDGQWQDFRIQPFGHFEAHPMLSVIHHGQSFFEGMKAFRQDSGDVVLFRPEDNAKRAALSAKRLAMPEFPEDDFVQAVEELLKLDKSWVPNFEDGSVYIRPFMFATDQSVGVKWSETYRFMVFFVMFGHYFTKPLKLKIEEQDSRAAPGGMGNAKASGGYACSFRAAKQAITEGFDDVLFTDACTHEYIEEARVMNVCMVKDGKLVTPDQKDTVLKSIVRDCALQIAQDEGIEVEIRDIKAQELIDGLRDGSVTEFFGTGTAAVIAPVCELGWKGERVKVPVVEGGVGEMINKKLAAIRRGVEKDTHNWVHKINH